MNEHPALDPAHIFPTYIGGNELSPFHHCYANDQTVLRLAAGRFFAHHNGDPSELGYWALRNRQRYSMCPNALSKFLAPMLLPFSSASSPDGSAI